MDLLRSHFDKWEWVGPGVVLGTDLSDFVQQDDRRRKALLVLFQRTIVRLRSFGGTIPLSYLTRCLKSELTDFAAPQPTERLVKALKQLIEMLA